MKKLRFFILILFVAVVLGSSLSATPTNACCTYPDGTKNGDSDDCSDWVEPKPTPNPAPTQSLGSGLCIDCFYFSIKEANFGVNVDGNKVSVSWLGTDKNKGTVRLYNNGELIEVFSAGEPVVYNTANFTVTENGTYEIQPVSTYKGEVYTGKTVEIVITGNSYNVGYDETESFEFKKGLLTEQIEDLLDLFYDKAMQAWTETDYLNWNYATR